jgi:RHS repeat-associated protein
VRQHFTQKERDMETGLDYFGSRYFATIQGRFTSADEPLADQQPDDPQSWNLYSYVVNNPLFFFDPLGQWKEVPCSSGFYGGFCWIAEKKDTFESLAQQLGVPTKAIKKFFSYVDPNSIQIGQVFDVSGLWDSPNTPVVVTDFGGMTGVVDPQPKGPSAVDAVAAIGITAAAGVGGSGGAAAGGGAVSGILTTGFHLTQAALEHIMARHWASSNAIRTGKFTPGTTARELKNLINEAVHKATPQSSRYNRQVFEYDFGRTIGTTSNGVPTSRIRVVLDAAGKVITAFPIR